MDKKHILLFMVTLSTLLLLTACSGRGNADGSASLNENIGDLHKANFAIEGMYCESCSYGVRAQFEELEGVVSAEVDYRDGTGVVLYDADKVNANTIALASTAYPATIVSDVIVKR